MYYFRHISKIRTMKFFFALFAGIFFLSFAFAQSSYTISGNVSSETGGSPLVAASVFAQNTTLGTVTDAEGNFKLQLPSGGYDLVITYTGYRTESMRISNAAAAEKITVKLREKEKELETVSVVSTNEVADGLAKYGSFFREEFIGKTVNSALVSVQNPEVLHFFFSKRKNRLKITATEPLIIKNNAFGYNIKYTLDSFTHEYNTQVSTYTGYPLFEEMQGDSSQKVQWEAARSLSYNGSLLHFMRSVFNKEIKSQKFEIQFIAKLNGKDDAFKIKEPYSALKYEKDDSTQTVSILPSMKDVGVLFSGKRPSAAYMREHPEEPAQLRFSLLTFAPEETIVIEQNGYFYDQNDISISGYWTWEKVGDQLPYDYNVIRQ